MARRRKKTGGEKAKALLKEVAKAGAKQSLSFVQGGAMAIVEEEAGEQIAAGVRAATVIGGVVGQALLDPAEHRHKHDLCGNIASGAMYDSGMKSVGKRYGKFKKARSERSRNEMISRLKSELEDEPSKVNGVVKNAPETVPVPKKRQTPKQTPKEG